MGIPARFHQDPISEPKFLDTQSTSQSESALRLNGPRALLGARLFSLLALALLMLATVYGAATAYRVVNDSFVAPIIFSPDNDLVIQNKLSLSRLLAERQRVLTRVAESTAALEIADRSVAHLLDFRRSVSKTLAWSVALTSKQAEVSAQEVDGLEQQRVVIENMTRDQEHFVAQMKQSLDAGLIRKAEFERNQSGLDQLRLAWLQNARDRLTAQVQLDTASLAQEVLSKKNKAGGLITPEMAAQRDHLMRVELDLMKLQAERQARLAQQRTDQDELLKIDELIADMKRRPIFRAIEVSQNVAFVPYSQREAVAPGSDVFDCKVWTVFACSHVGKVSELLPGEVATQDPWGTPTRGQYALLELSDGSAAMSKALRVRKAGGDLVTHALRMTKQGWQGLSEQVDALQRDASNTVGRLSTRR
jgi:hypothetical protein